MAIRCDICGTRIFSGRENCGSFRTPRNFISRASGHDIENTCEGCGLTLDKAIVECTQKTVEEIRQKIDDEKRKREIALCKNCGVAGEHAIDQCVKNLRIKAGLEAKLQEIRRNANLQSYFRC